MVIRESAEMYLETILVLSKEGAVRSIDVAKALNFSRPSVSVTLHNLEKEGYLSIAEDQTVTLLAKGLDIAKTIYERHTILTEFFEHLENAVLFKHIGGIYESESIYQGEKQNPDK